VSISIDILRRCATLAARIGQRLLDPAPAVRRHRVGFVEDFDHCAGQCPSTSARLGGVVLAGAAEVEDWRGACRSKMRTRVRG